MTPAALARRLLPQGVAVAGGPLGQWHGTLHADEMPAVARAVSARRAEFTAGRMAARAAIAALDGLHAAPPALPKRPDGPPLWPPGLTGSITHGGGQVLAAVGRLRDLAALGLDIEPAGAVFTEIAAEILTAEEARVWPDKDPTRAFCAKEAAYKAQFTLTGRLLDFHQVVLAWDADHFVARLPGLVLHGQVAVALGLVIAAVAIPA